MHGTNIQAPQFVFIPNGVSWGRTGRLPESGLWWSYVRLNRKGRTYLDYPPQWGWLVIQGKSTCYWVGWGYREQWAVLRPIHGYRWFRVGPGQGEVDHGGDEVAIVKDNIIITWYVHACHKTKPILAVLVILLCILCILWYYIYYYIIT